MKPYHILLLIVIFITLGCTNNNNIYHNTTTIYNHTLVREIEVKEVQVPRICPKAKVPVCEAPVGLLACERKLTVCSARVDSLDDHLYDCLTSNTTGHGDSCRTNLTRCEEDLEDIRELLE